MTGASDTLDPIAAAERGIAGSKNLIAAVADELSQQQRWLAHYQVAEKRHARRLKFQELIYWLEIRRRRLMRMLKRLGLALLSLMRSVAFFVSRTAISLFVILRRTVIACATWLRPRAYALARTLRRWLAAFWAWTLVTSGILARTLLKAASISFAWICLKGGALARAALKAASISRAWLVVRSRELALLLQRSLSASAAWTGAKADVLARASLATGSAGFSWAVVNVRRISLRYTKAERPSEANHRGLAVRQCTALVCLEPRRARLPAIRAS